MDQLRIQLRLRSFKVPSAAIDFSDLPTATPSPPVETFVRDVEGQIIWPQIPFGRMSPPVPNHPTTCS